MKVFATYLDQNLMIKMINIKKPEKATKQIQKTPNASDYLKSLSQEGKELMDEIEDADNDIDIYKFVFIGSNKEKFNFNTFKMPLNFLSAIQNGEISLEEAKISQKNEKERKEINRVLMQANDLLEYRNKIIEAFRDGTFLSEHLKKSDNAAYDYVLKDVNNFTQEIKSIKEKNNLTLFKDFFGLSSPADYAKKLINIQNPDENKGIVAEIKNRTSNLKDRIKRMSEKEKKI